MAGPGSRHDRMVGTPLRSASPGPIVVAAALLAARSRGFLPGPLEGILFKNYRLHAEARPRLWRAAAAIAKESPWLGVGPGARRRLPPPPRGARQRRRPLGDEHGLRPSEPLQAAAETGLAGLALWLLGAGAALRALFGPASEDPVQEAAAAAAAAMTAHLAIDNMLQIPALAALWLTALAMTSTPAGPCAAVASPGHPRGRRPRPGRLDTDDARRRLARARPAALFPAEPGPREDLAYAAMGAGKASEAETHWMAAQSPEPFNAIHPLAPRADRRRAGSLEQAEPLASRAIELEPGFMNARLLRAETLVRLGR